MDIPNVFSYPALAAVLVFLIVSFARGWIIPQSTHEREMAAEKRRGDEWKGVADERGRTVSAQTVQINALLESSTTLDTILKTIGPPSLSEKSGE